MKTLIKHNQTWRIFHILDLAEYFIDIRI